MEKVYLLKLISCWLKPCFEQLPIIFVWCWKTHWEALKRKTIIVEKNVCIVITYTINTLRGYNKDQNNDRDIEYWTNDLYMLRRVHQKAGISTKQTLNSHWIGVFVRIQCLKAPLYSVATNIFLPIACGLIVTVKRYRCNCHWLTLEKVLEHVQFVNKFI